MGSSRRLAEVYPVTHPKISVRTKPPNTNVEPSLNTGPTSILSVQPSNQDAFNRYIIRPGGLDIPTLAHTPSATRLDIPGPVNRNYLRTIEFAHQAQYQQRRQEKEALPNGEPNYNTMFIEDSGDVPNLVQESDSQLSSSRTHSQFSVAREVQQARSQTRFRVNRPSHSIAPQANQSYSTPPHPHPSSGTSFATYSMPAQYSSNEDLEDDYEDNNEEGFEKDFNGSFEEDHEFDDAVDGYLAPANDGAPASSRQCPPGFLNSKVQYPLMRGLQPANRVTRNPGVRPTTASWSRGPASRSGSSFASSAPGNANGFTVPHQARKVSRASGNRIRASVNKGTYQMVDNNTVSDASLLKRGLSRTKDALIAKRAMGPNDPENLKIVNMVDNLKMRWTEIADQLNKDRVAAGRSSKMTANCVHNRYNRNAPILFEAEGRTFIPIHLRKTHVAAEDEDRFYWDTDRDQILVEAVKAVEAEKWTRVAKLVNQHTGGDLTPGGAATRHRLI